MNKIVFAIRAVFLIAASVASQVKIANWRRFAKTTLHLWNNAGGRDEAWKFASLAICAELACRPLL